MARHRLIVAFAILCFIIALVLFAGSIFHRGRNTLAHFQTAGGDNFFLVAEGGSLCVAQQRIMPLGASKGDASEFSRFKVTMSNVRASRVFASNATITLDPITAQFHRGFCWMNLSNATMTLTAFSFNCRAAAAPMWLIGIVVLICASILWRRMARRDRRLRAGLCEFCGYDLRASPDRCPECGREPGAAPSPGPAGGVT